MMVWWDLSWISAKISEVRENISKYIADCNYKTRGASSESAKAGSKHRLIRCIGGLILKLSRPRRKWLIWSRCNPQCCDQISLAHERRQSDWNSSKHKNSYSELEGPMFTPKFGRQGNIIDKERHEVHHVHTRNERKYSLVYLEMYDI